MSFISRLKISFLLKRILPLEVYVFSLNKRNIDRAVRDFPLPDSPTIATTLLLGTVNEMLFNNIFFFELFLRLTLRLFTTSKLFSFKIY